MGIVTSTLVRHIEYAKRKQKAIVVRPRRGGRWEGGGPAGWGRGVVKGPQVRWGRGGGFECATCAPRTNAKAGQLQQAGQCSGVSLQCACGGGGAGGGGGRWGTARVVARPLRPRTVVWWQGVPGRAASAEMALPLVTIMTYSSPCGCCTFRRPFTGASA